MTADQRAPVLMLVVCAAPPALQIHELVEQVQLDGWTVQVIATPTAMTWIDTDRLAELTDSPVRATARRPDEPKSLPKADAVAVVPATFNTINQWCAGVNNTLALGVLNEALGSRLPIITAPYAKPTLAAHPVFGKNLRLLVDAGVDLLPTEAIRPTSADQPFHWELITQRLKPYRERALARRDGDAASRRNHPGL
ncbi:flavoprotein [Polymorphospora rubra]|uniref:flavoprotein n=1 Tax=Polymorphospora rubra TaxID=338584 RepID=UPI00340879AD